MEAVGVSKSSIALGASLSAAALIVSEIAGRVFPTIRPLNWLVGAPLASLGFIGGAFAPPLLRRLPQARPVPPAPSPPPSPHPVHPPPPAPAAAQLSPQLQDYVRSNWKSLGFPYTIYSANEAIRSMEDGVPANYQRWFVDATDQFAKSAICSNESTDLIEDLLQTGLRISPSFRPKLPGIRRTALDNSRQDVADFIDQL